MCPSAERSIIFIPPLPVSPAYLPQYRQLSRTPDAVARPQAEAAAPQPRHSPRGLRRLAHDPPPERSGCAQMTPPRAVQRHQPLSALQREEHLSRCLPVIPCVSRALCSSCEKDSVNPKSG